MPRRSWEETHGGSQDAVEEETPAPHLDRDRISGGLDNRPPVRPPGGMWVTQPSRSKGCHQPFQLFTPPNENTSRHWCTLVRFADVITVLLTVPFKKRSQWTCSACIFLLLFVILNIYAFYTFTAASWPLHKQPSGHQSSEGPLGHEEIKLCSSTRMATPTKRYNMEQGIISQ